MDGFAQRQSLRQLNWLALGVGRSTAWALLNRDKRTGPSSVVLKRILSSPNLPPAVRRKVEQYINEKIAGRYGHTKRWLLLFRNQFRTPDNEAEGGLQEFGADLRRRS